MLHFAYGSNMNRALMRKHAMTAQPIGVASLPGHRFVVTADGYASVVRARARTVHGVLWRLAARDRVTLDAWENLAAGLYCARTLAVRHGGRRHLALVYLARQRPAGRPKPGYMELVIAAAQAWNLPADYVGSLQRFLRA
jgi:hypothetical protein